MLQKKIPLKLQAILQYSIKIQKIFHCSGIYSTFRKGKSQKVSGWVWINQEGFLSDTGVIGVLRYLNFQDKQESNLQSKLLIRIAMTKNKRIHLSS